MIILKITVKWNLVWENVAMCVFYVSINKQKNKNRFELCKIMNNNRTRTKIGLFCGPIGAVAAMCGGKYVVGDTGGLG